MSRDITMLFVLCGGFIAMPFVAHWLTMRRWWKSSEVPADITFEPTPIDSLSEAATREIRDFIAAMTPLDFHVEANFWSDRPFDGRRDVYVAMVRRASQTAAVLTVGIAGDHAATLFDFESILADGRVIETTNHREYLPMPRPRRYRAVNVTRKRERLYPLTATDLLMIHEMRVARTRAAVAPLPESMETYLQNEIADGRARCLRRGYYRRAGDRLVFGVRGRLITYAATFFVVGQFRNILHEMANDRAMKLWRNAAKNAPAA